LEICSMWHCLNWQTPLKLTSLFHLLICRGCRVQGSDHRRALPTV
jgi:hypothetical protein